MKRYIYAVKVDAVTTLEDIENIVKDLNDEWATIKEPELSQTEVKKGSVVNQDFMDWFERSWKMNNGKR